MTWVIILIIFVFDPLAVGLLIASQYAFNTKRYNVNGNDPGAGKVKVIEKSYEISDVPPKDIQKLEKKVEQKKEK